MRRRKIKVVITKIFEAEFEDAAAPDMFRTLERDRDIGVMSSSSGVGWRVNHKGTTHVVNPEEEES